MATKQIPNEAKEAVKEFVRLPDKTASRFVAALQDCPPTLMVTDLTSRVAGLSGLGEAETARFLEMLGSMSRSRAATGQHIDDFMGGLRATLAEQSILSSDELTKEWPRASGHIANALRTPSVEVSSKAFSVLISNEKLLCHARILSDIRPVFLDENLDPAACLILHQLKVAFHEHGDYQRTSDMYVTLEHSDLLKLKEVIDRALAKHEKLKTVAAKSEMPLLSFKE